MQQVIQPILELYKQWRGEDAATVDVLQQSGSERRYLRIHDKKGNSVIGTHGANLKENETFIYFSNEFRKKALPVATIYAVSNDNLCYLQEDFGDTSLINILESEGLTDSVYSLFKISLAELATLQVKGNEGLDYSRCLTNQEFGKQAIMADLFYFKYYFLDALRKPYDKQKLIDDFEALSNYLAHTEYKYFMFRDFQSRNIMITLSLSPAGSEGHRVHFIDYQGGMRGAPQYDVASMLWQARANLPEKWKEKLLEEYMDSFEKNISVSLDRDLFRDQYNGYVLIRLLQVLGAYGFRGLFERKAHFLTSIPLALQNLQAFLKSNSIGIAVPEFQKALDICISDEVIQYFTPLQAAADSPLLIKINSFSFKKGIPEDTSDNGGGYVFDCRGLLNPGRIEEFKMQTGRDKAVKDYLEQETKMPEFINSVFDIVDITVEDYIKRNFESLMISFGCTGGQHRSVYAADAVARHLRNKFKVKIQLHHREQNIKEQKGF